MPLHKVVYLSNNTKLYLWKITEDFDTLFSQVKLKDSSLARLETMKSESHQKGFLAVRMLLQHNDYSDFDLFYDEFGKPHLKPDFESLSQRENSKKLLPEALEGNNFISISHSNDFSAIAISDSKVGLDLEQLKEKTLRIAKRFMDVSHLENLSEEEKIKKATVVWGIKESIFKIKNEKGISFPEHIFEEEFDLKDGKCEAELHFNNQIENFQIHFYNVEAYIFVCAFPKK